MVKNCPACRKVAALIRALEQDVRRRAKDAERDWTERTIVEVKSDITEKLRKILDPRTGVV